MDPIVVLIQPRAEGLHACMQDDSRVWGYGKTKSEAIGNMVSHNPACFNFKIEEAATAEG
jgi:hypothetical protein